MKAEIEKLNHDSPLYLTMYFVFKGAEEPIVKMVDLAPELITSLATKFKDFLVKNYTKDDLKSGNLSSADERNYDYLIFDVDIPSPLDELKKVSENPELPKYKYSTDKDLSLDGYLFIIGNAEIEFSFFKEHYPVDIVNRESFTLLGFNITQDDTRFVPASDSDIFKISDKIDLLQIDNALYVLNPNVLERNFKVLNILNTMASAFIDEINKGFVENVAYIHEIISQKPAFARKVLRVNKKSPVMGLPFGNIKAFVEGHPHLKGKLGFNTDGSKFQLTTKISAELFVKLMDDDFLKSELSQQLYDSIAKDGIILGEAEK
jgi:hypothetical protein